MSFLLKKYGLLEFCEGELRVRLVKNTYFDIHLSVYSISVLYKYFNFPLERVGNKNLSRVRQKWKDTFYGNKNVLFLSKEINVLREDK